MDQATNTLIALGGGLLIALLGWAFSSSKVETQVVDADDAWSQFDGVTSFQLTFYRQSGNTHRVVQIHGTREDVEAEIRKVFNRAGIRDQYMVGHEGILLITAVHTTTTVGQAKVRKSVAAWYRPCKTTILQDEELL